MGAANAIRRRITDYGADPADGRTLGLAADIWSRVQGWGRSAWLGAEDDPSLTFNGDGPQLQMYLAPAYAGGGLPISNDGYPDIASGVVVDADDPVRRIFADRLRRRSGGE